MTDRPLDQGALVDMAIQRSAVDEDFRKLLLKEPVKALQDMGIDVAGVHVTVHEFDPNELLMVLPPFLEEGPRPPRPAGAHAAGAPSPPMRGLAECALLNPADNRAAYGALP
jgi:hypothetical protein